MNEISANKSLAKLGLFLQDLTELTNKYNIVIKGCGCCGSPWLEDLEYGETYDNLTMEDDRYVIEG